MVGSRRTVIDDSTVCFGGVVMKFDTEGITKINMKYISKRRLI